MAEFKIRVDVELNAEDLEAKLKALGKEQEIELKLDTNKIESQLKSLKKSFTDAFKLDNKVMSDLNKIGKALKDINKASLGESKSGNKSTASKLISDYKELYNTVEKLQKQLAKGGLGEEGLRRTQNQINDITNMMNKLKNEMSDSELANLDFFESKKSINSLIDLNGYLNKIESQIDSVKNAMDNVDTNFLSDSSIRDLDRISNTVDELRASLKGDILLEIDVGTALNTLKEASESVKKLQNEAKQASIENEKLAESLKKTSAKQHADEMSKMVNEYKELSNVYSNLQKQMASGGLGEGSLDRTISQISELQTKMKKLYDTMDSGARQKIDLFNASQSNKALVDMNNYLNKIESTATGLQNKIKSISFEHIDASKIDLILAKLEEFQTKAREGIDLDFKDIGSILNDLEKLSTVINDLIKVENLANEFERVKSAIAEAGGDVEKFEAILKDLENRATTLKGTFEQSFGNAKNDLKEMTSEVKRFQNSTKNIGSGLLGTWDDFKGNFAQFTLAEIAGDFIADGIRTLARGLKDTVVETDSAITDLNKVYEKGLKGDNLKQYLTEFTEVAKQTGKTSVDVIQGTAKAVQSGISDLDQALVFARQSAIFSNVGDIDQGQADTMLASIMSAYGGVEESLKPVREQVQGMGKDYNTLTKFMDLAKISLVVE